MDPTTALKNLKEVSDILKSMGLKHWVSDGSLLGLVREGKILDHDSDTDMGVMYSPLPRDFRTQFENAGFEIKHVFGEELGSLELALVKNGVKTDLFFFYRLNSKCHPMYSHSAFYDFEGDFYRRVDFRYRMFLSVRWKRFQGTKLPIPANYRKYLKTKYGDGWSVPVKIWDYVQDPENAQTTNIFYSEHIQRTDFFSRYR